MSGGGRSQNVTQTSRVEIPAFLQPLLTTQANVNQQALQSLQSQLGGAGAGQLVAPYDTGPTTAQQQYSNMVSAALAPGGLMRNALTGVGPNPADNREVEDHGQAVAVLPYDPIRKTALLVEQFRTPPFVTNGQEHTLEAIAGSVDERTACVLLEPVQGETGVHVLSDEVLHACREACDRHGVHLIADEIAVGFGRTGSFFACEQAGIVPDLLCLSKGISGGYLPLSAVLPTCPRGRWVELDTTPSAWGTEEASEAPIWQGLADLFRYAGYRWSTRGEPDDIAKAVEYLLTAAPYVTGQVIAVDGGRSVFL